MNAAPSGTGGAPAPLGLVTNLAYGIGGLGDSVKTFCFTTFLLFYYTTVLELSGTLLGIAMAVGLVWDAVIDPFIGHMSDRSTWRLGRRHAFMLAGSVVAAVSFMAVFNPPSGLSGGALFTWLLVTSMFVRSANSLFLVPYFALGSELTADYHERTSLAGFRAGAVLVGTLLVTAAAFMVFLPNGTSGGVDGKFFRESYESMGIAFGLVIVGTGLVATFGTLRERYRLPPSAPSNLGVSDWGSSIKGALGYRAFRVLLAASALSSTALAVNAALILHYLTYHAKVPANEPIGLSLGGFYVGALAGVAVWVRACRRIEKPYVYAATVLASGLIISSGYWLVGDGRPFGTGNVAAIVALTGLAGFFSIGGAVLGPSMMADVTAFDEQMARRRRDGTFFGMYSFGQQLSGGVAVLIAGVLVDRFAGLLPGQAEQSAATVERIAMISSLLPAALQIAAGLVILRYDLRHAPSRAEGVAPAPATGGLESEATGERHDARVV